jgi:hypothetical protein
MEKRKERRKRGHRDGCYQQQKESGLTETFGSRQDGDSPNSFETACHLTAPEQQIPIRKVRAGKQNVKAKFGPCTLFIRATAKISSARGQGSARVVIDPLQTHVRNRFAEVPVGNLTILESVPLSVGAIGVFKVL